MERARFRRQAETSDAQLVPTRPAGGLLKLPGFVGTPSTDIVSNINPSTTLFLKLGILKGETPKPAFAYFCLAAKVGRARGHETSSPSHSDKSRYQKGPGGTPAGALLSTDIYEFPSIRRSCSAVSSSRRVVTAILRTMFCMVSSSAVPSR